jgi:hypothetical protein
MLENQQAQDYLCRHPFTAAAAAFGMALRQGLVHGRYDFRVGQNSVGCRHPMIAQITYFLRDQPITEAELGTAHLNHAASSLVSRFDLSGATGRD